MMINGTVTIRRQRQNHVHSIREVFSDGTAVEDFLAPGYAHGQITDHLLEHN